MSDPTPKYVAQGHEIKYGGGLLLAGELVPPEVAAHIPETALTDEPPPSPSEPEGEPEGGGTGPTGGTGSTGATGSSGSSGNDEPEGE